MSPPVISVIIPFFNAHETIGETITSVTTQNLDRKIEIIVIDDVSKEPYVAPVLDGDISIVSMRNERNIGPASSRNRGLRMAHGKYVCFLDADDLYGEGFFRYAFNTMEQNELFAAFSTGVEIMNLDRVVHDKQMLAIECSLPSNLMTRRSVLSLIGGFPEADEFRGKVAGEDCALRAVLDEFFTQAKTPEKFFRYRNRPGSHLEHFLKRSDVAGGTMTLSNFAQEEASGQMSLAFAAYRDGVRERIGALRHLNPDMLMALATS